MGYISGLQKDSGQENGYYNIVRGYILGLYTQSGKDNGNNCIFFFKKKTVHIWGPCWFYIGRMEKKMDTFLL